MISIKTCKDCKHFMTDCSFLDKDLQAMEDFIACKHFKPKNETNADKIRATSDEELANFLDIISKAGILSQYTVPCNCCLKDKTTECDNCWKEWLKLEAE